MAATVGTGNIVGVATAIQTGGPGALFWMWMAASWNGESSMQKVCWPFATEPRMTMVTFLVVRCTTFFTGWERSGVPLPSSLP